MDTVNAIFDWLESREGVLSAIAALAAIFGISYAILAFIFPSFGRALKRLFGHEDSEAVNPKALTASSSGAALPGGPPIDMTRSSIAVLPLRTLSNNILSPLDIISVTMDRIGLTILPLFSWLLTPRL